MEIKHIYLDNSATTKICDEALNKYIEVSKNCYGNPSSLHSVGLLAEKEITNAKNIILSSVAAKDSTVIFTSSGTEANNLAILGRAFSKQRYRNGAKIITTRGEHASVSLTIEKLKEFGFKTAEISTNGGCVNEEELIRELTPDVVLVSTTLINNETGAIYDIKKISALIKQKCPEALLHVDATQGYMKIKISKQAMGADMLTLSSHKIEGPKGVGALVIDKKILTGKGLTPITIGGGQELGLRSGTENVPGIAAFAEAVRIAGLRLQDVEAKLSSLKERLISSIEATPELSEIKITKPPHSAPHIINITLPKIKSETMLHYLSSLGIFVSSGSACSSNHSHKSSALIAYGKTESEADTSIRISISRTNTEEDIDALIQGLVTGVKRLARIGGK